MTISAAFRRFCLSVAVVGIVGFGFRAFAQSQEPVSPQDARDAAVATLLQTRACRECDLTGATFNKDMNLKTLDLTGAKLAGAFFYRTDLTGSNFSGADLSKANLSMADLTNVNFGGANLDGAMLTGAIGASLAGVTTTEATVCPDGQQGPCR